MWPAGPEPIDPAALWPLPIIEKIVTSFSRPGERVMVLPWPDPATPADAGRHAASVPGELTGVLTVIADRARSGSVLTLPADPAAPPAAETGGGSPGGGSRPFWADLLEPPATVAASSPPSADRDDTPAPAARAAGDDEVAPRHADLIITSLPARLAATPASDAVRDQVAWCAARLLRTGGILAVLTHCDWSSGELIDPTGPVIAAAQNADLLYLQHIVAMLTPIRDGALTPAPDGPGTRAATDPADPATPGTVWPAPHHRAHADLVAFSQPGDHNPDPVSPAAAVRDGGIIR